MSFQFHCPSCRTLLSVATDQSGSIVNCPRCRKEMKIPHVPPPVALPVPKPPVGLAAKQIDDGVLPFVDPEPLYDRKPHRGKPIPLAAIAVGVTSLFILLGLIFLNLPANDGPKADRPAVARQGPDGQAQPGGSETGLLAFDPSIFGGIFLLVVVVGLGLVLYVLPTIIAFNRGHQNAASIAALNILLGWAFVGWVGALVWALTEVRSRDHYHYHHH